MSLRVQGAVSRVRHVPGATAGLLSSSGLVSESAPPPPPG